MSKILIYTHPELQTMAYDQAYPNLCLLVTLEQPQYSDIKSYEDNIIPDGHRACTEEEVLILYASYKGTENYHIIDDSTLPDNYFRKAFEYDDGGNVYIEMIKAIEVHKNYLRDLRLQELLDLDVKYFKALEINNAEEIAAIVARKNVLRNITKIPEIESATTPEELKIAGINIVKGV